jgi:hypothetical protein
VTEKGCSKTRAMNAASNAREPRPVGAGDLFEKRLAAAYRDLVPALLQSNV